MALHVLDLGILLITGHLLYDIDPLMTTVYYTCPLQLVEVLILDHLLLVDAGDLNSWLDQWVVNR